jgi:hypothetical protein
LSIFQHVCCNHKESKSILSIEQTSSILSFVNIGIYFISTWLYYNQIVVTFRLGTRLSSSNQISVLNTPLYCRKVSMVKQHYCKYYCIPFLFIFIFCCCWIYVLTHAHSHTYEYNYFPCRFFIMFVVIFNKSKIIKSIEQTLQYLVIHKY